MARSGWNYIPVLIALNKRVVCDSMERPMVGLGSVKSVSSASEDYRAELSQDPGPVELQSEY
jgi:hypothetical protein